jgi:hypothetical protein
MRINAIRSSALPKRPGRSGRGWRASNAAEAAEEVVVENRRPAIEGDYLACSSARTIIRPAAALQTPSTPVLQALKSYALIAAMVAEPGDYLDTYA